MKKIKKQGKEIYKKLQQNLIFLIPLFFLLVLSLIYFVNEKLKEQILNQKTIILKMPVPTQAPYPILNSVLGVSSLKQDLSSIAPPNISAQSAIILDDDSKAVLFAKNKDLRSSMASTAKIMTALIALEFYKMDDVLTVKNNNAEGVVVGFRTGEKVTFENLLYAMLLPSGNDAAFIIAQNYKEGEEEFVRKMNEKAKSFYLYNTHFQDPAGLIDNEDYTTAIDLARLTSIALKNDIFAKVVATEYKFITDTSGTRKYHLYNLNKLLGLDGVNGVKTGFTDEAGGVLVTSKMKDGHRLIIVVMKSQDRFLDTQNLLNFSSGIDYLNFK